MTIPEEDLEGVATVGQAVDLVLSKAAEKSLTGTGGRSRWQNEHFDHRGRPRVVVTGVGLQTPAGIGLDSILGDAARGPLGRGADPALRPDAARRCASAARSSTSTPSRTSGRRRAGASTAPRRSGFAAAADALADAGDPGVDPARGGVIAGTGIGGLITLEEQVKIYLDKGPDRVSPFFVPMMMANATAGIIGIHLGWIGPQPLHHDRVRRRRERDRRGDPAHPRRRSPTR